MSRHIIADKNPDYHWVVGYDRPLNEFFYQKWLTNPPDDEEGILDSGTIDCDWADCRAEGMQLPDALVVLLVKEACGQSDTNACKDWRGVHAK